MILTAKIIPPICTCGNRLGYRQKEFEETLIKKQEKLNIDIDNYKNEENEESMKNIENETIIEFGWNKICCRKTYICNSRIPFIRDSNKNAYIDTSQCNEGREDIYKNGIIFIPSKKVPDFPKIREEEKKIEVIEKKEEENIPKRKREPPIIKLIFKTK